nr:hypothetical protein [uncultured Cohaesibacter sp.]
MNERNLIPQDADYFHAIGLAIVAFARLEWNAVWCCERLKSGYIQTIEIKKKTAGKIAMDLEELFLKLEDTELRKKVLPLATSFKTIVADRNALLHGKPGTAPNGDQRLFRHGDQWTIDAVNRFSDACVQASTLLNALLYDEFKEPCTIKKSAD